ncbi:hypothetical protein [Paenisporosarcina sp. NPDC076898]|uniref:hypothetical protein n=1 Tax=unclassified Paenisporosarcina TaxID=2642018 RepID=UPI003D09203B
MDNIDNLPEVTVGIFKITTPKCGYFVFWTSKSDRVNLNVEPFREKEGDINYPAKHHINGEDLLYFKEFNKNIVLYHKQFKAQSWEDAMKYEIYSVISNGSLNRKAKKEDNTEVFVRFIWNGKELKKTRIEYQ